MLIAEPDSVLGAAERATTPLWIVPPGCAVPPRRILLGTDFSRASVRAGRSPAWPKSWKVSLPRPAARSIP